MLTKIYTCQVCGKKFYCDNLELWVFKRGYRIKDGKAVGNGKQKVFCSYRCSRQFEKDFVDRRKKNGKVQVHAGPSSEGVH